MKLGGVFDDRQAQARSSDLPGVTLVNAVKPFKHSLLLGGRNSDACVLNGHTGIFTVIPHTDDDLSSLPVIFHSIVTQVVDDLANQMRGT